jgi:hypothetical protein
VSISPIGNLNSTQNLVASRKAISGGIYNNLSYDAMIEA